MLDHEIATAVACPQSAERLAEMRAAGGFQGNGLVEMLKKSKQFT